MSAPPSPTRFALVSTQRMVLPVAGAMAVVGGAVLQHPIARLVSLVLGVLVLAALLFQRRLRPEVEIGPLGYRVFVAGRERFLVRWADVVAVRADQAEHALYVDCGDRPRNLFVPPARGYGFRFLDQARLYELVVAAVPDRVQLVDRLDPEPPKAPRKKRGPEAEG